MIFNNIENGKWNERLFGDKEYYCKKDENQEHNLIYQNKPPTIPMETYYQTPS